MLLCFMMPHGSLAVHCELQATFMLHIWFWCGLFLLWYIGDKHLTLQEPGIEPLPCGAPLIKEGYKPFT